MDEASGIGSISDDQRYVARAAASADQLAARFGTPTWSRLLELAGPLARNFRIADVTGLAAVLSEALAKVGIVRGQTFFVTVGDREKLLDRETWDEQLDLLQCVAGLRIWLEAPPSGLDPVVVGRFAAAVDEFLASAATKPIILPDVTHGGKKTRKRSEAYPFVIVLARDWPDLTGEKPVAYRDRNRNECRGSFWRFVERACAAVGIEQPSIQSVEGWLKEIEELRAKEAEEPEATA